MHTYQPGLTSMELELPGTTGAKGGVIGNSFEFVSNNFTSSLQLHLETLICNSKEYSLFQYHCIKKRKVKIGADIQKDAKEQIEYLYNSYLKL